MLGDLGYLGSCPVGQLESDHIETHAVIANSVNDYGLIVGKNKDGSAGVKPMTSSILMPIGISCPTCIRMLDSTGIACINVFLFRNRQAVPVQTSDAEIEIGKAVFIDSAGLATQTLTSGWRIGVATGLLSTKYLNINNNAGTSAFLLELSDPVFI